MSIKNLDKMFNPRHVAVVGAGRDPRGLGHLVLSNLVGAGFKGVVSAVGLTGGASANIPTYRSLLDTPTPPDLAVVCTPATAVPDVVRDCGARGVAAVAVLSAGFKERGPDGAALERRVGEELARHRGMRLLGPNCLGLIAPGIGLNASFAGTTPIGGHVALVSQSGALTTAVVDWAATQEIGFSAVVSVGNMADVDLGDLIDYCAEDAHTHAIVLYVEAVTDARKFMSAARACARGKPIIVYKTGRFAASARVALSHTGTLAGEDAVYDVAFRRAGLVRVRRLEDVFATAALLAHEPRVRGPRLAVVTNAGGPGVMAADALIARGGELAPLAPATVAALDRALSTTWSHTNPVDVLGDASSEDVAQALGAVVGDHTVDAALVILTPQAMTDVDATADVVVAAKRQTEKPVLASFMGGAAMRDGIARLTASGVAHYAYPDQAVDAFMDLVTSARNLELLYETPRSIPVSFALDRSRATALVKAVMTPGTTALSEPAVKSILQAYGIAVTTPLSADSPEQAVARADELGYPVVVKVRAAAITHKSDVGGVALDLETPDEVAAAFRRVVAAAGEHRPKLGVAGVTVQRMARGPGYELVLGARKDRSFGSVIVVGAGGFAAEVAHDEALELPPLNERLARRMLESLRIWPLLAGYRDRPGVDLDALLEVLMRFSYLVADHPELAEVVVNPLLVGQNGAVALDGRALVDASLVGEDLAPFAHLAIRPYPEEYIRATTTTRGLSVVLRPIRPEDEPAWHEMLDACSPESLAKRFQAIVRHSTHEFATRYCFTDYDRELAIVAEVGHAPGTPARLAGVGRLVADPDRQRAEFAVLVADPYQGEGLGELLTRYCLEVARPFGVEGVFAETTPDNIRMVALLRKCGFAITRATDDAVVVGERPV